MRIEEVLRQQIAYVSDSRVRDAMEYSLLAGGKRIRPNLLYAVLNGYGKQDSLGDCFAAAIEMIHTYSLIHDDLPAMDNDDLRRGRPTCHKQFDEATAILAGDGLLTYAFETALRSQVPAETAVKCVRMLAQMAGPDGMVHGQDLDMNEDAQSDWAYLKEVHNYKTGCLLSIPLMIGACVSDQSDEVIETWHTIGTTVGLAFQIQDDILDVELSPEEFGKSNSDQRNGKVTSVTLLGKEKAEEMMNDLYSQAINTIREMKGFDGAALVAMIEEIRNRRI
ncbi:MAG: polyprenyl synthetase family protein [Bulleidia sp.]